MKLAVIVLLALSTLWVHITLVQGRTYLKLTKIECVPNPQYIYNHTCRLRAINRYKAVAIMNCWIRDQLRNTSANIAVYARNSANIYMPFLVNITINVCQFFEKKIQGPYGHITFKVLQRFTNINHSCPYTGILSARDGYFDTSLIPSVVPTNAYKVIITFFEDYPKVNIGFAAFNLEYMETKH